MSSDSLKPKPFTTITIMGKSYEDVERQLFAALDPVKPPDVHVSVGLISPIFSLKHLRIMWQVEVKKYHNEEILRWQKNIRRQSDG